MRRPGSSPRGIFAGGGVYPERSRGARNTADTVQIHVNTILAARTAFEGKKPHMHIDPHR